MRKDKFRMVLATALATAMVFSAGCNDDVSETTDNTKITGTDSEKEQVTTAAPEENADASDNSDTTNNTTTHTIENKIDEKDENTDWQNESYEEIVLGEESVTISEEGTYVLSGELKDGQIVVDAPDSKVWLVLNGVNISCSNSSAVYVKQAKRVVLTMADGTENTLADGETYDYADAANEEPNACIYSKDDMLINGAGSLKVTANMNNGISGSNDVLIVNTTISVTAKNHGIRGKDSLCIKGSDITVDASGDGMKSTNAEEEGRGFIYIENGNFNVTAAEDGIQAESSLIIENGEITVSAADDGIKAEDDVIVHAGTINITKSTEGIEGMAITINGGDINVVASDDGLNAAGGTATTGGWGHGNPFMEVEGCDICVNGGNIVVDASGDGIDANGNVMITGGTFYVYGPTNGGNGALDYGGEFIMSGGTLMAAGAVGMAENISSTSTQCGFSYVTNGTANSTFMVKNSTGDVIAEMTPTKTYQSVIVSTPDIKDGETYTIYVDGKEDGTITQSGTVTSTGGTGGWGGGMGGGNLGGGNPGGGYNDMPGGGQRPNRGNGRM